MQLHALIVKVMKLVFKNWKTKSDLTSEYLYIYLALTTAKNISRYSGREDGRIQKRKEKY